MIQRVVIIPNKDNAGKSLRAEQARFEGLLLDIAGGFTFECVHGAWRDDAGKVYHDASRRYTTVVSTADDILLCATLPQLCQRTRQEAIFTSGHVVSVQFVESVRNRVEVGA